jgi:hypothetical protein
MHAYAQHKGVVTLCAHSDCACMHVYMRRTATAQGDIVLCADSECTCMHAQDSNGTRGVCCVLTLSAHACMRRTGTAQGDIVLCADSDCACMHAQDSKRRGICAVC